MTKIKIGKVGLTNEGVWSSDKLFPNLGLVTFKGQAYISLKENSNVEPGTDNRVWMLIAERGESLYQMMVREHLFEGSEEEFLAEYRNLIEAAKQAVADNIEQMNTVRETMEGYTVNEQRREEQENSRQIEERVRTANESTRESQEHERQEAERVREQDYRDYKQTLERTVQSSEEAVNNANSAAQEARNAGGQATSSAASANSAASKANSAADKAKSATSTATSAAQNANSAASSANGAASKATTAAGSANSAASKANTASQNATKVVSDFDEITKTWAAEVGKMTPQTGLIVTLKPNTYNCWSDPLTGKLSVTLEQPDAIGEVTLEFVAGNGLILDFKTPDIKWVNGEIPYFEAGRTYIINIARRLAVGGVF